MKYKLGYEAIGHVVQLLQQSILTGVDISDLFRLMELTPDSVSPDCLNLDPEYKKRADEHLKQLVEKAAQLGGNEPSVLHD